MSKKPLSFRRVATFAIAVSGRFALLFCIFLGLCHFAMGIFYCVADGRFPEAVLTCPYNGVIGGALLMVVSLEVEGLFTAGNLPVAIAALAVAVAWASRDHRRLGSGWA